MTRKKQDIGGDSGWHKQQTEWHMVLGGFVLIVLVGGFLLWLLYGSTVALVGVGIALGAITVFAALMGLLKLMETWAKSH